MQQYAIKKQDFNSFVNKVMSKYEFIAPVKGDNDKTNSKSFFNAINSPDEIFLAERTLYPAKGFFFASEEVLFRFDGDKIINPVLRLKPQVLFGLRKCDLNSIYHQDIVFLGDRGQPGFAADPYYKARRDNAILIGYHCKEGWEYCFCNSFKLMDFFDLMFYDKGEFYGVEIGSEKGQKFLDQFNSYFKIRENFITPDDRVIINHKSLNSIDIKGDYNSEAWKTGADQCIACGACNFLCPNCHCFSIDDEVNMDLKSGSRVRKPASCQLKHFTRVAGDHIFRDSKLARFKHRIYHQIQYFNDRHGIVFCTGCGRCIDGCPAKIDWVKIINDLKSPNKV